MLDYCDKCQGAIEKGKCPCGSWYEKDNQPNFMQIMEKAIYAYDHMCEQYNDDRPFSGDHHTGNCVVYFKGDYDLCEKVKQFIIDQNYVGK